MVLLEFAMNPPDRGDGLSGYVARIIDVIDRSGVTYRLTPMGTIRVNLARKPRLRVAVIQLRGTQVSSRGNQCCNSR